jgi:hypothetical protein
MARCAREEEGEVEEIESEEAWERGRWRRPRRKQEYATSLGSQVVA